MGLSLNSDGESQSELIGVQFSCFRRFCQALIHIEPQGPQIIREGLQEFDAAERGGIPPSCRNRAARSLQGPGRHSSNAVAIVLAMSRR